MTSRRYSLRWPLAAVVVLAAVTFAGAAPAQDPDDAAVDEYVEMVPAGGGGEPASNGEAEKDDAAVDEYVEMVPAGGGGEPASKGGTEKPLSTSVTAEIERKAGSAAPILRRVATSSRYGAPQQQLRAVGGAEEASDVNAIATAGSGGRLGILLIMMLVIGTSAVAVAARRHRQGRGADTSA